MSQARKRPSRLQNRRQPRHRRQHALRSLHMPGAKPIAGQQRTAAANDPADAPRSIEKPTPSQAQATARTPLVTQAGAKSNAVQKLAAAGNDLVDAPHSIVKPAPAESASRAPEPTPNERPKEKGQKTTEQAAIAAPETSFPIRVSGPVAKPAVHLTIANPGPAPIEARANVQAPAEQDNSHAAILAASSSPSVSKSPVSKSPGRTARPDSKPPQPASTANGQTASPEPTPLPAPVVTPAPTSPSDVLSTPSANVTPQDAAPEQKTARPSAVSDTVAASSAPTLAPAPVSVSRDVMNQASDTTNSASRAQREAWPMTPAPKTPLLPQAENFAFAVRMLGLEGSPRHSPVTQSKAPVTTNETSQPKSPVSRPQSSDSQPRQVQSQASSDSRNETQPAANETVRSDTRGHDLSHFAEPQQTPGVTAHWNDAAVFQAPMHGSIEVAPEPAQAARPDLPLAAQESHLLAPELPKTPASSEILLHLTGNDQSAAAIRVADRAGSVSVSVHASDPVLRESLRSNLGDLSNQLSAQGWRADVLKPAAVAAHSGGQQDSHAGGERSSSQQQSNGGDRQPQRERRANGGQWQQELEQEITGGSAHPGGNE